MTIVEAGARRDLGELDAALRTLENAPLRSQTRADWVVRLRYAYADTLLAAGRTEDAVEWFHRTVAIDGDEITDAEERVAELERGARATDAGRIPSTGAADAARASTASPSGRPSVRAPAARLVAEVVEMTERDVGRAGR